MASIWVDADACPIVIRDILFKAAERRCIPTTFVANQLIKVPPSKFIKARQVAQGFDVADNEIARQVQPDDLVITQDIPLAAEVMEAGAHALTPRGEMFTQDTIRQRLNMRDFMDTMRASGVQTGGPPPLGKAERKAFADNLDRLLTKLTQNR